MTPAGAPPPRVRGRGRPASDDATTLSTAQLLDAALDAFAERGYDGTSVRELARDLGVSPLRRAQNTLGYVLRTTFGNTEAATSVIERVKKVHSRINGTRPDVSLTERSTLNWRLP